MFSRLGMEGDRVLREAGMDAQSVPNVRALCVRLLGSPPRLADIRQAARLESYVGKPRILVRAGTPRARARWLACHELAHWWLIRTGQEDQHLHETQANVLGASILAPSAVIVRTFRTCGANALRIARAINTTQSLALLRVGEVGLVPTALVYDRGVIVRGHADRWRHVAITDEPNRIGLLPEN